MRNTIVRSKEEWIALLDKMNETGATYVAAAELDEDAPATYPVLVKTAVTVVYNEEDEPIPAYVVILVTQTEAAELLNSDRFGLEDYKYAEAL